MNMVSKKIIQFLLIFFLVLVIFSSLLISMDISSVLENFLLLFGGLNVILLALATQTKYFKIYFTSLDFIYGVFILFGVVSSYLNNDLQHGFSVLKLGFIYFILVSCQRNLKNVFTYNVFFSALVFSSMIILLFSIFKQLPFNVANYSGVFGNPNNFGVFITTLFVYYLSRYVGKHITKNQVSKKYLIYMIILFYFALLSSSRTALYGIVLLLLTLSLLMMYLETSSKLLKGLYLLIIVISTLFIIMFVLNLSNLGDVFGALFGTDEDATVSRTTIWQGILNTSSLFGAPSGYIAKVTGHTSHNTFLEQIGRYGWLAGCVYILFWLISLIKAIKFLIKNYNKDENSITVFAMIFLFILMSIVELLSHNTLMFVALFSVGYLQEQTQESYFYGVENEYVEYTNIIN